MKKILAILFLVLMWCNVGFAECIEDRINKIEKFLKLDQPVSFFFKSFSSFFLQLI